MEIALIKNYNAVELRTPIIIETGEVTVEENNAVLNWYKIFDNPIMCKWMPVSFKDDFQARLNTLNKIYVNETALVIIRYSPLVTRVCRIFRVGDDLPYEVISAENLNERNLWLEMRVFREVNRI